MMGLKIGHKIGEITPFTVMVMMEGCTIALTILAKTVITGGISPFVFVVYTNGVASLILLPYSFFYHRERTEESLLRLPLLLRFFFLGLIGICISQNLAFVGLSYSSPIVVCAMGLLIPAFSFILAIFLRKAKLDWTSSSFQYKMIGTLVSIAGAAIVAFYKGPFVQEASSSSSSFRLMQKQHFFVFYSTPDKWVLGCLLLAGSSLCFSLWNIIQSGTVKLYPQVMKIASFYSLAGTIQCAIFSLLVERDLNAWKLKHKMDLLLIIVTAIFSSIIRSNIQILFSKMKGPFYVPLFQPFRVFWATLFGVSFFANSLHYGSVIGTIICGMGFYTVTWGNIKEEENRQVFYVEKDNSIEAKVPLLQEDAQV